jgi:SAM-dependent methyltransferase
MTNSPSTATAKRTASAGSADTQEQLWSGSADDWATVQEQRTRRAYEVCLDALDVRAGTRLLDVGCGAGLALRLAADRGAEVTGLDATEALLRHARRRVPGATMLRGDIEALPFEAASFDIVTGFNAFQYAARPSEAIREAVRSVVPGGRVLALVWGPAEQSESGDYLAALGSLLPPPLPGAPGPIALSDANVLSGLLIDAGLVQVVVDDVSVVWAYDDAETALRGLLSSGPAVAATKQSGKAAAKAAVLEAIRPYQQADGSCRMTNVFRYAIGTVNG